MVDQVELLPTIDCWKGTPLSEVPRDELEREFAAAHAKIARLQRQLCDRSVEHIRDLARARRELASARASPIVKLLNAFARTPTTPERSDDE